MLVWTFMDFPEQADPLISTSEALMTIEGLIAQDNLEALQDFVLTWQAHYEVDLLPLLEQVRFRYLLGKAYTRCADWYAAVDAFAECERITVNPSLQDNIPLLRAWAYAAHEAHEYETAIRLYERLILAIEFHMAQSSGDFLHEDPVSFLCNIYRNLAFAWLYLSSPEVARSILEEHALPLLQHYSGTLDGVSADQRELNWRLLHLYVPWLLGYVIAWQVRLSSDPRLFQGDLFDGYDALLTAAQDSRRFPEGHTVSASIHNLIAEVTLMRCAFASNLEMQTLLCSLAQQHLNQMTMYRDDNPTTLQGRLQALVLELSQYELDFRKHIIFDTVDRTDPIIIAITDLYQQAQSILDPSYQLFAARCLLLLGTIAAEKMQYPPHPHTQLLKKAQEYFQQALDNLKRDSGLPALFEQEVLMTMKRFGVPYL